MVRIPTDLSAEVEIMFVKNFHGICPSLLFTHTGLSAISEGSYLVLCLLSVLLCIVCLLHESPLGRTTVGLVNCYICIIFQSKESSAGLSGRHGSGVPWN